MIPLVNVWPKNMHVRNIGYKRIGFELDKWKGRHVTFHICVEW